MLGHVFPQAQCAVLLQNSWRKGGPLDESKVGSSQNRYIGVEWWRVGRNRWRNGGVAFGSEVRAPDSKGGAGRSSRGDGGHATDYAQHEQRGVRKLITRSAGGRCSAGQAAARPCKGEYSAAVCRDPAWGYLARLLPTPEETMMARRRWAHVAGAAGWRVARSIAGSAWGRCTSRMGPLHQAPRAAQWRLLLCKHRGRGQLGVHRRGRKTFGGGRRTTPGGGTRGLFSCRDMG